MMNKADWDDFDTGLKKQKQQQKIGKFNASYREISRINLCN